MAVPPSLPHAQGPQTQVPLPKWPKGGVLSLLQSHCGGRPQTGKLAVDSCPLYTPIRPLAEGPHQVLSQLQLPPLGLLLSQGPRCIGHVMTPLPLHMYLPFPAPACSSNLGSAPLLWEALSAHTRVPCESGGLPNTCCAESTR